MRVELTIEGQRKLLTVINETQKGLVREITKELRSSADTVKARARAAAAAFAFTGTFIQRFETSVSTRALSATVRARAPHAWIIARGGRRPGKMPPPKELIAWLKFRGIPERAAFVVARAIQRRGIKPRPVVDEAWAAERPSFIARVTQAVERLASSFSRG